MTESGSSMRAVIIENIGRPRALKVTRIRRPQAGAGEVLVKIHASSVNPQDALLRSGRLLIRKPMPHILGADLAGEIAQLGDDVEDWQIGDRVAACFEPLGCEINGAYAEYCALPAEQLTSLPDDLDYQSAVAAGAAFADAFLALVTHGKLKKADTVVVRGAGNSLGASAVQIAAARGAKVIAISESDFAGRLREIGAAVVLEDASNDLLRQVQLASMEEGASLILHCSENLDLAQSLGMLRNGGRLVIACALRKPTARFDALDLHLRKLSILGASGSIKPKDFESILRGLAKGTYRALVDEVMPLSQVQKAHRKLEKSPGFGKILLVPDSILEAEQKPSNWIPIE